MDLNYSIELALYFDRLRYEKNLTQEEFVDSIISLRQYRRYLNGTSYLPQEVINKFAERLGYRSHHVLLEFEGEKIQEGKLIAKFYNAVATRDHETGLAFIKEHPLDKVIDRDNRLLYTYTCSLLEHQMKKISDDEMLRRTITTIDYPEILNQRTLSQYELMILSSLVGLPNFHDKDRIVERLVDYADHTHLIYSGRNERMLALALYRVAQYYGMKKEYQKVLDCCDRAITYNIDLKLYYLLDSFYYFKALAHHHLGQMDDYETSLFRCYATLQTEGNPKKYERFRVLVEKDWPIHFHTFAKDYIEKMIVSEYPST